jgi:hypothetical protein
MISQSPEKWFSSLTVKNKTIVLSKLVYEFTIIIRDITISPLDDSTVRKLRGVGEMTHRIMPYVIALNSDNNKRFADEDLIKLLFEMASSYGLDSAFAEAWHYAASMTLPREH